MCICILVIVQFLCVVSGKFKVCLVLMVRVSVWVGLFSVSGLILLICILNLFGLLVKFCIFRVIVLVLLGVSMCGMLVLVRIGVCIIVFMLCLLYWLFEYISVEMCRVLLKFGIFSVIWVIFLVLSFIGLENRFMVCMCVVGCLVCGIVVRVMLLLNFSLLLVLLKFLIIWLQML